MPKVLVFGGTGLLGRPVVYSLLQRKYEIRLFTSRKTVSEKVFGDKVEYAEGQVSDIDAIKKAIDGCDYIYISLKGGPTLADYERVELEGSKNIYTAAKNSGIKKIVQQSEARADEKHSKFIISRVKYEAQKALEDSGHNFIVLKPTWFCESLPLTIQANKAILIGSGQQSFFFLAAADFANIVGQCLATDKADRKALTIFGPEPMPVPEAMRRFLEIAHPDISIDHLPVWMARFISFFTVDKSLKMAIKMMAFYDKYGDDDVMVGPEEADRIFGRCPTTVEEWATVYRKVIKGV